MLLYSKKWAVTKCSLYSFQENIENVVFKDLVHQLRTGMKIINAKICGTKQNICALETERFVGSTFCSYSRKTKALKFQFEVFKTVKMSILSSAL